MEPEEKVVLSDGEEIWVRRHDADNIRVYDLIMRREADKTHQGFQMNYRFVVNNPVEEEK